MKKLFFLFIFLSACDTSTKLEMNHKNFEMSLRKTLISKIQNFEISDEGILLKRNPENYLPMGSFDCQLRIRTEDSSYLLVWRKIVKYNELRKELFFRFNNLDEIYVHGSNNYNMKQIIPALRQEKIEKLLKERIDLGISYSHFIPAFCNSVLKVDQGVGFTKHFYQVISEKSPEKGDTLGISNYIVLNQLVLSDLLKKGLITKNDTVFVSEKYAQTFKHKTLKMKFSDERLDNFWQ